MSEEEKVAKVDSHKLESLMKWGKIVGVLAAFSSAIGGVWSTLSAVSDLHQTILSSKQAIIDVRAANETEYASIRLTCESMRSDIAELAKDAREARELDRETTTNLRIAIAAMQAAQFVREGTASYGGIGDITRVNDGQAGHGRANAAPPPMPPVLRSRRQQESQAIEDASSALLRVDDLMGMSPP